MIQLIPKHNICSCGSYVALTCLSHAMTGSQKALDRWEKKAQVMRISNRSTNYQHKGWKNFAEENKLVQHAANLEILLQIGTYSKFWMGKVAFSITFHMALILLVLANLLPMEKMASKQKTVFLLRPFSNSSIYIRGTMSFPIYSPYKISVAI